MDTPITLEYVRQSNLIEGIDNPAEDRLSLIAWGFIADQSHISEAHLLHLHKLITVTQLSELEAGMYRDCNVYVGDYVAPAPFLARQLVYNWLLDLAEHWSTLDPKQMHIRFEKIHPFVDGNGRTGRMLMWWHELMQGKEPTLILNSKKQDYYKWFKETR